YQYYVKAYNVHGESLASDTTTWYTWTNVPGSLQASEVNTSSVTLTWSGDGTIYDVVKAADQSFSTEVATFTLSAQTTTFMGLTDYTTYWFRVRAYNGDGVVTAFATEIATRTVMLPPTDFAGVVLSTGSIQYTWTDNSNNESGYRVYNATNSVAVSGDLGQGVEEYTYENLRPNTSYQTYVVAFGDGLDESLASGTTTWYTWANIPGNLTASAVYVSSVTLTWSGDGTLYEVVKAADQSFSTEVATFTLSAQTTTFMGLTDYTTYWFRVRAYNGDGVVTAFATEIATRTIFNAPTNHGAVVLGTDSMKWLWDDNSDNETGYRVYATTGGLISGDLNPGDTYYTRSDLTSNTSYQTYVVAFGDGLDESIASNTTKYFTLTLDPTGFDVSEVNKSSVTLVWDDTQATRYEVVSARDENYSVGVATLSLASQTTTFAGLIDYTTYWFKIRAFNGDDVPTLFIASVSTRTLPDSLPDAPSGFAGNVQGIDSIEWVWNDVTKDDGYRVYNATNSSVEQTLGPDAISWLETGLTANTSYHYFVRAFNVLGESGDSNHDTVYTHANIPANLEASAVYISSVTLTWTGDGSYYDVVKAADAGFGTEVSTYTLSSLTTTFMNLTDYTTYWFKVRAYNGDDVETAYTTAVSTRTIFDPPTNHGAVVLGSDSMKWLWDDNSDNETGYRVYATTGGLISGNLNPYDTYYTRTDLTANTSYQTYVVAFGDGIDESLASNTTKYFTLANDPDSLQVTAVYSSSVTVVWNGNQGSYYDVVTASAADYSVGVATITLTQETTTFTGLDQFTYYWFKVRAYNGDDIPTQFITSVSTRTIPSGPAAVPQNFVGVVQGVDRIEWGWDDVVNETEYRVYNSTSGQVVKTLEENTTYWLNTGLQENTSYQYHVTAYNVQGESGDSNDDTQFTYANPPTGTQITESTYTSVSLSWTGSAATRYEIEQSTNTGSTWNVIANILGGTTHQQTGLTDYTSYWYQIRGFNGAHAPTAYDSMVSTRTLLIAPTGYAGTVLGTNSIKWDWIDNSNGEYGYRVYTTTGGAMSEDLVIDTTTYTRTNLTANTSYQTYVVALGEGSFESAWSNTTSYFTFANDPTGLTVTPVSASTITVTFSGNGGSYYQIVGSSHSDYSSAVTTKTLTLQTTDFVSLAPFTYYWFKVRAFNGDDVPTQFTDNVSTRTLPSGIADVPQNFVGVVKGTDRIEWGWDDVDNETGYRVYNATSGAVLQTLEENVTYWLNTNLASNTSYQAYVRSFNVNGESGNSNSDTRFTFANPPTGTYVTATTTGTISLEWIASEATRYEVEQSTNGSDSWDVIANIMGGTTNQAESLSDYTTYWYRVRGFNGASVATAYDTTIASRTLITPPTGHIAVVIATDTIKWNWIDNSGNEIGYRVMASTGGRISSDLGVDTTVYTRSDLSANTQYNTYVVAYGDHDDVSLASNTTAWYTWANPPFSSYVSAVTSGTVSLAWSLSEASRYEIERSTNGVDTWTILGNFITSTTHYDTGLDPLTTYYYQIRGFNGDNIPTAYDTMLTTRTLTNQVPVAPSDFSGEALTTTSIKWEWTDNAEHETGFRVYSSTGGKVSPDLGFDTTSWVQVGLSTNTSYENYVVAFNANGESTDSNTDEVYTLSELPTGFAVAGISTATINLAWNPDASSKYDIRQSTNGVDSWNISATLEPGTTHQVTGLDEYTTYYYGIRSFNGQNLATGYTANISTTTLPYAATGFTSIAVGTDSIKWNWFDVSNKEHGYRVYSSTGGKVSGDLSSGATVWTQTGLDANTAYTNYVRAFAGYVESPDSNTDVRYTHADPPTGTQVTAVSSSTVSLSWTDSGATQYDVERSTNGVDTWEVKATIIGNTTHQDTGLSDFTSYWYRVRGYNGDDIPTVYDSMVSTRTLFNTPTLFAGTAVSTTSIHWEWIDNSGNEDGYRVYSSTGGQVSVDLTANLTYWTQASLEPNTTYQNYVRAYGDGEESSPSNTDILYTLANPPTGTYVISVSSYSVSLAWNSSGATRYEVEQSTTGTGSWSVIVNITGNTTHQQLGLSSETTYWYQVRGFNGNNEPTAYDTMISTVTNPGPPLTPTVFAGVAETSSTIKWTWTDNSWNEEGFRVYSSTGGQVSPDLSVNATYWVQSELDANTQYQNYVRAYNITGESGDSNMDAVYTYANPPVNTSIVSVSSSTVGLDWTHTDASRYAVERSTDGVTSWAEVDTVLAPQSDYTDTNLNENTTYYYRIGSYNADDYKFYYDAVVSTKTYRGPPQPPAAFWAVTVSTNVIKWLWTDVTTENGYRVYSSTGGNMSGDLPVNTTFWILSGLDPNQGILNYHVRSFNETGESGPSNSDSQYTFANPPLGSTITLVTYGSVSLSWQHNNNTLPTKYGIERSTAGVGVSFTEIDTTNTGNTYVDNTVDDLTTYYYRIRAYNGYDVPTTYDIEISTWTPLGPPDGVDQFDGEALSQSQIRWTWEDLSDTEDGFRIMSSTGGNMSGDLPVDTTTYTEINLSTNTAYARYVQVYNAVGYKNSDQIIKYTLSVAPVNLTVLDRGERYVQIGFDTNGNPAGTYYETQYRLSGGEWTTVPSLSTATIVMLESLQENTTYTFRVRSLNGDTIASAYCSSVSTVTLNIPPDPVSNLTAEADLATGYAIDLTWQNPANEDLDAIIIVWRTDRYPTYANDGTVITLDTKPVPTAYRHEDLSIGTTYYYLFYAVDEIYNYSTGVTVQETPELPIDQIKPREPTGIRGIFLTTVSGFKIKWSPVTVNEDGSEIDDLEEYCIYRSESLDTLFKASNLVGTVSASVSEYTDSTYGNKQYFYCLRAKDKVRNYSRYSMIVDSSRDINMYAVSDDLGACISIPSEMGYEIWSGYNGMETDIIFDVERKPEEETGRVLRSYVVHSMNAVNKHVMSSFQFSKPKASIVLDYQVIDGKVVQGDGQQQQAPGLGQQAPDINADEVQDRVGMYWFNGVKWIKVGGEIDVEKQQVSLMTERVGAYQIRYVYRTGSFLLDKAGVYPRIFSPNNDGWNDVVNFV
ncbi:MAG: hypothetical protein GF384_00710, partial [Elusimicrobia bacterium]|nr:hypothetical protein [Elusimicrobiota bacterium]